VLVAVAVLAATVVARFATTNAHADVIAVLQGSVGPDFAISLKNPDGSVVNHLDGGPYEIQVNDQATNHNFHLEGPGVSMATGVPDVQTADWMVTFGDGVFAYHCDQHLSLTASFAVGNATIAPPAPVPVQVVIPPPPASAPAPVSSPTSSSSGGSSGRTAGAVARLGGTVRITLAGTALKLTLNGKTLARTASGTYKVVVSDTSAKGGVTLRGGGVDHVLTTAKFTGTKTVTIDLDSGQWKITTAAGKGATFLVT
jgi:hypothetical protein